MGNAVTNASASVIRRLTIERYRGIEGMDWRPAPGVNVILGGGDVGKTTILEAIALLFCPTNFSAVYDTDYWNRRVESGFSIEAVISLPDSSPIHDQALYAWPWRWDGSEAQLPNLDGESQEIGRDKSERVYRVRVRGTADFELSYELLQPNESADTFSTAVRLAIGLVLLAGDDRYDRDLRLVQGSALDRLLSDKALRARVGQKLSLGDMEDQLNTDAQERLRQLDQALKQRALPAELGIGLTGSQGFSINALIGLTAVRSGIRLPLACWGAGTRRLTALQIAASYQGEYPITLVDEVERGLEPYRQRVLLETLQRGNSQVFLTTHSAAAISASLQGTLWYVDSRSKIGLLGGDRVRRHQLRDPEAFLARLTIVAEGRSEVGFVSRLLQKGLARDASEYGIRVTDGDGNENTLRLLEGLGEAGMQFGGFADNEGSSPARWGKVQSSLGKLLFRWSTGCLEENVIRAIPRDRLEDLITDPNGELTGERLRTLADRLGIDDKEFSSITAKATDIVSLIVEAATGAIPDSRQTAPASVKKELRKHGERWFKSIEGGEELADKAFQLGAWPTLEPQLLPFLTAVADELGLAVVVEL